MTPGSNATPKAIIAALLLTAALVLLVSCTQVPQLIEVQQAAADPQSTSVQIATEPAA